MTSAAEGVQVTVAPAQSSYFSGETFDAIITFKNVNSHPASNIQAQPTLAPKSFVRSHRRATQSIASPFPITPSSAGSVAYQPSNITPSSPIPKPRYVVGKRKRPNVEDNNGLSPSTSAADHLSNGRRKHSIRSLSVASMQPSSLSIHPVMGSTPEIQPKSQMSKTNGAYTSSPLASSQSNHSNLASTPERPSAFSKFPRLNAQSPIPVHHPHARKQSVLDVQSELQEIQPVAVQPGFTQSLDTISESGIGQTPLPMNEMKPSFPSSQNGRRSIARTNFRSMPSALSPPDSSNWINRQQPRSASASVPTLSSLSDAFSAPGRETLLWAYAQLVGTIELDPTLVPAHEVEALRTHLRAGMILGGGRMDIDNAGKSPNKFGYLPSLFSSTTSVPTTPGSMSFQSPPLSADSGSPSPSIFGTSLFSTLLSPGSKSPGLADDGLSATGSGSYAPLPTLETQPSMLAVDLDLDPGQSRSYAYSLPIPSALPPTYRGHAFKFSYTLIIGTSRSPRSSFSSSTASLPSFPFSGVDQTSKQRSRVMRIPVRVYNHVAVGRIPRPYDLLWPVARRKETRGSASVTASVVEVKKALHPPIPGLLNTPERTNSGTAVISSRTRLGTYAALLLDDNVSEALPGAISQLSLGSLQDEDYDSNFAPEKYSCRQSVDVMTRNPKKVSYDIAKGGEAVAVLTFVKSAYRVGETILGVVDVNLPPGHAKVLKLSAALEAQETLPLSIRTHAFSQNVHRRIHSEYALSFAMNTQRAFFSLDIPADATPTFDFIAPSSPRQEDENEGVSSGKGGLEWRVRLRFLVAVSPSKTRNSHMDGSRGPDASPKESDLISSAGTMTKDSNSEDATRFQILMHSLLPDGPRGEWAASWHVRSSLEPLQFVVDEGVETRAGGWMDVITGTGSGGGDVEPETKGTWKETSLDVLECEVPVMVWPSATAFQPVETIFNA